MPPVHVPPLVEVMGRVRVVPEVETNETEPLVLFTSPASEPVTPNTLYESPAWMPVFAEDSTIMIGPPGAAETVEIAAGHTAWLSSIIMADPMNAGCPPHGSTTVNGEYGEYGWVWAKAVRASRKSTATTPFAANLLRALSRGRSNRRRPPNPVLPKLSDHCRQIATYIVDQRADLSSCLVLAWYWLSRAASRC